MIISEQQLINSLREIYDPEVSVNIYDLGLIYDIKIEKSDVYVTMTLTSPFCPAGDQIVDDVKQSAYQLGAKNIEVKITFQPEWGPDQISDEGKLALGLL